MSNFQLSIIGALAAWVLFCWLVARFLGMSEDGAEPSDDDRIDSVRQSLRPDPEVEVRSTDFGGLEPRPHVRAGDRS